MNYNATSGVRHPAQRKKHVSNVAAVGGPPGYTGPPGAPPGYTGPPGGPPGYMAPPPYNPYSAPTQPSYGMPPPSMGGYDAAPPPPYQPDYSQMHGMPPSHMDQGQFSIPGQFLSQPAVANVAMQYGQALMGTGKQIVDKEIEKYVPVSRLKYYFAVDTSYVAKKLGLLVFPFTHSDWSLKYEQNEPVQPRYEVNAPDLYIPTMAFVTYVLVAGLVLGMQNRFSPEVLGIQASSALAWLVVEVLIELVTLYVTNIETNLKTLDLIAFGGYKYVGIIFAVLLSLLFHKAGYYIGLIYCGASLVFFLLRTLRIRVLSGSGSAAQDPYISHSTSMTGHKRRLYLLLFIACIQPVLMWWLSYHLIMTSDT